VLHGPGLAGYGDSVAGCLECGFNYELAVDDFAAAAIPLVDAYAGLLGSTGVTSLRVRPSPDVWSALEHACHVRDLLYVQRERVLAARRRDRPNAESMGCDQRGEHDGYANQRPGDVARQLGDAALLLSNVFRRLSPDDWDRTVIYPPRYPDPEPEERSLRWVATHTLHELHHHLLDVRRQLDPTATGDAEADRCSECGFVYDLGQSATVAQDIRQRSAEVAAVLRDHDADLRSRRQPGVWSPLEYGCHLRDMLLVQRERVLAARRRDRPDCLPSGRGERVVHDGYAEQKPEDVARQLTDATQLLSNVLDRLTTDDWDRTVIYHYPVTSDRSVRWVAVHTLHETHHHLLDIRRQL
jgi:hypothetical protein